jgi:hypothetical protein
MHTKPKPKPRYRLRNWPEYEVSLRRRGSLTIWLEEALPFWIDTELVMHHTMHHTRHGGCPGHAHRGHPHRGHPRVYSDAAITCMLTMKAVFHVPLRATVGMVSSVLELMGHSELPVADPATISRRSATLEVTLPGALPLTHSNSHEPLHLVVDSSGLKVYGEGEWKVKKHGWTYHRRWIKMHLGVDVDAGKIKHEIRVLAVSRPEIGDGQMLSTLLSAEQSPIAQVTGDGAYHSHVCYEAVAQRPERPLAVFPPPRERRRGRHPRPDRGHELPDNRRKTTKQGGLVRYSGCSNHIWQHGNCKARPLDRDEHVRRIRRIGRERWKKEVDYNKRSLIETTISRMDKIFGPSINSRKTSTQTTEVFIRAAALNRMTALGMPDSYRADCPVQIA